MAADCCRQRCAALMRAKAFHSPCALFECIGRLSRRLPGPAILPVSWEHRARWVNCMKTLCRPCASAVRIPVRGAIVEITRILTELRAERDRIERAISALEAFNSTGRRGAGRPPKTAAIQRKRGRMSAAARRKLSRLLKQRWAEGKMKPGTKAKPQAFRRARRMSRAARNKIAAAQRARWAKLRAQQAKSAAA